ARVAAQIERDNIKVRLLVRAGYRVVEFSGVDLSFETVAEKLEDLLPVESALLEVLRHRPLMRRMNEMLQRYRNFVRREQWGQAKEAWGGRCRACRQCGAVRPSPGGARRRADEAEQRRARCQSRSGAGKTTIILTAARVNAYRKGGRQRGPVAVRCTGDMAGQLH